LKGVSVTCYVSLLKVTGNVADTHPTCAPGSDFSRTSLFQLTPKSCMI